MRSPGGKVAEDAGTAPSCNGSEHTLDLYTTRYITEYILLV